MHHIVGLVVVVAHEAQFMRQLQHRVVIGQHVAVNFVQTLAPPPLDQAAQQMPPQPLAGEEMRNQDGELGAMPVVIDHRSEEHTSELQSLMRISYAVFCLKKKKRTHNRERKTGMGKSSHNRK